MAVDLPYDWDDYRSDFVPSSAYVAQEAILSEVLSALDPPPASVLEVGPGFGRVTKILTQVFSSEAIQFYLSDLSEAAIRQTSEALTPVAFTYEINALQDRQPFSPVTFDLVVAIEVLLHIPPGPTGAQRAVNNLAASLRPPTSPTRAKGYTRASRAASTSAKGSPSGLLITCDWTQALSPGTPVRNQNFRHDYASPAPTGLFASARPALSIVAAIPTGLQTIFVLARNPTSRTSRTSR